MIPRYHRLVRIAVSVAAFLHCSWSSAAESRWTYYVNGNAVNDVTVAGQTVWCATTGSLVSWDRLTGDYRQITVRDGLPSSDTAFVAAAPTGGIWVGYSPEDPNAIAISRFEHGIWTTYSASNCCLPARKITCATVDSQGLCWVGTRLGGIARFDGDRWEQFLPTYEPTRADAMTIDPRTEESSKK